MSSFYFFTALQTIFNILSSIGWVSPTITRECRGLPRSHPLMLSNVSTAIVWLDDPTLATPTHRLSAVRSYATKKDSYFLFQLDLKAYILNHLFSSLLLLIFDQLQHQLSWILLPHTLSCPWNNDRKVITHKMASVHFIIDSMESSFTLISEAKKLIH